MAKMARKKPTRKFVKSEVIETIETQYPDLELQSYSDGSGKVEGVLMLDQHHGYTVDLKVPKSFPKVEPSLFVHPNEIPWVIDRHVFPNGKACLCVRCEIRKYWPWGSNLAEFISNLVTPFFLWQSYFDTFGSPPPTGERAHNKDGIIEAVSEILTPLGDVSEAQIKAFLILLSRTNNPGGHEMCPCLSGRKIRHCHREFIEELRTWIDPRHAEADFREAFL